MQNSEVAKVLSEISEYLEMQEERSFRSRAYRKAAETIGDLDENLEGIYNRDGLKGLTDIPGVGASIAEKIEELLSTGKLKYYESLKKETPIRLDELTRIEGLGPKSIKRLHEKLGVKNLDDLEKAAKAGKIRSLEDFGEKSEENILQGIEFQRKHGTRVILGYIMPFAEVLRERLDGVPGTSKVTIAGSYRRRKETVGDLDILVVSKKSEKIMDYFVNQKEVDRVLAHGPTKSSVRLSTGIDVDLRVVPSESYGAALAYFTGSKAHNVAMREIAQSKGMKLNEYGLYKGKKMVAGGSEKEVYEALGLKYVEPEMREDLGELELSWKGKLPKLISYGALEGDLQVQSDWTDGKDSIHSLAKAAMNAGLQYIAITDHTKRLAMTNGLDEKRLRLQMKEIDAINKKLRGKFTVLKGSECDILKDGALDLPDEVLKDLDVVGISVHSYFNLSKPDQTKRIIRAVENPHADILFHPTGRLINKRKAYDVDIDAIVDAAKKTKTILEINAFPDRTDLKDEYIRKCVDTNVKMSINSDAHSVNHFGYLDLGVAQARRGWAGRSDIINAWPLAKCLSYLKNG
jgi:DNA polymerase (family X)